MTVYVDKANIKYGRMIMCHMLSESLDELHAMADIIGVNRKWFQHQTRTPHYDICLAKKKLALQHGAKEITRQEVAKLCKIIRVNNLS